MMFETKQPLTQKHTKQRNTESNRNQPFPGFIASINLNRTDVNSSKT